MSEKVLIIAEAGVNHNGSVERAIEMIDVAATFGAKVYFGDGTRIDLLRQAGADEAEMILIDMV